MVRCNKIYIYIFFFLIFFCHDFLAQNISSKFEVTNSYNDDLAAIKVCKWKNNASTCLVFSFDDNNLSSKSIAQVFDKYGYKCTFFVNSSYMYVDSLKLICENGHEIGNHTYSHVDLTNLDSTQAGFQIRKGKEMIENALGVKCVSIAEPGHLKNSQTIAIEQDYHLFDRDFSAYTVHDFKPLLSSTKLSTIITYLKNGIKTGNILFLDGHGIEGDGYSPITKDFLVTLLDSVKRYSNTNDLWVTTLKDGVQYENLYHELKLEKTIKDDTLKILFVNYNKEKYKDLDISPISVEIPLTLYSDFLCVNKSVEIQKFPDKSVLNIDLKNDTSLVLILNSFKNKNVTLNEVHFSNFDISPNPANQILNLKSSDEILQVEIYNMDGSQVLKKNEDLSKIDISVLEAGAYLIKVEIKKNNSKTFISKKFMKE